VIDMDNYKLDCTCEGCACEEAIQKAARIKVMAFILVAATIIGVICGILSAAILLMLPS